MPARARLSRSSWSSARDARGDPRRGRPQARRGRRVPRSWAEGQSRVAARRHRRARRAGRGARVVLGDQPLITPEASRAVTRERRTRPDAVRAAYDGVPGHPVVLSRRLLDRAGELRGDAGIPRPAGRRRVRRGRPGISGDRRTSTPESNWRRCGDEARAVIRGAGARGRRCGLRSSTLERVAPCLPGAAITEHDEDGIYRGEFKVKLGPTTLVPGTSQDRGRRRGKPHRHMRAKGDRQARPRWRAGQPSQLAHRRGRRHARGRGDGLHDHRAAGPPSGGAA